MKHLLMVLTMIGGLQAFALIIDTSLSGKVEISCDQPGSWRFEASSVLADGREVVSVRLASPVEATPPRFKLRFQVSGAGVQNVWTANCDTDGFHFWPDLWHGWKSCYTSQLAFETPIAVGFNSAEISPVAIACSEAFHHVVFELCSANLSCDAIGRFEFFTQPTEAMREYEVKVLIDRRGHRWYDVVRDCSRWIAEQNGFRPAFVPESAYDPLYSTWYAYLQDIHAEELEREAPLAAALGMKTMIIDDGWQKVNSRTYYSATGDWQPVPSRFRDMKAHVRALHKAGMKCMLWLSVPFMGDEAQNYERFKPMLLKESGGAWVLDPRFPEVRDYLIETYERVVGEWGFDGVKLDFIDQFTLPKNDPALKDNYAGRDYRSLPQAVDRLMKDVLARLQAINPDVLIEFRQHYIGPAILQYGNMIRAMDCPADPCANRRRICDLRLTSGKTAVHSDMLVWSREETPEGAALPILNALFSTIQYSMVLANLNPAHGEVIRHWLRFSQEHREALLKGEFRPHHPEVGYPWIEAESAKERIVAVYSPEVCVNCRDLGERRAYIVNASGAEGVIAELEAASAPRAVTIYDVIGRRVGAAALTPGAITRLAIPASGYARVELPKD